MTPWVIGFATKAESPSEGTWRDSRLGGYPIWPGDEKEEGNNTISHPEIPLCPLCNQPRLLLLQAYAPHPNHEERFLVVFACNSAVCGRDVRSWCAFRGFQPAKRKKETEKTTAPSPESEEKEEVNWDSSSDGSYSSSETSLGELESMLNENLNIGASTTCASNKKNNIVKSPVPCTAVENAKNSPVFDKKRAVAKKKGRYFWPNFIEVEYDKECSDDADEAGTDANIERLLKAYEASEAESRSENGVTAWGAEDDAEETDAVVAVDEFRRAIRRYPEQVLRYNFGGDPLWPKQPAPELTHDRKVCAVCGKSENVFEVQILGSALYFMGAERAIPRMQQAAALNFMAVAIYTCVNDCEATRHEDGINAESDDSDSDEFNYQYHGVEVVIQPDVW